MEMSVIICTHNPRPPYLRRVLEALREQTLPMTRWELVLVDNASTERVEPAWDLSWHPHGRHVREEKLGLVHARTRGIRESSGDILVFVDDDNLLATDYLETAEALFRKRPDLGIIGPGLSVGEFEAPPPPSIAYYVRGLIVWDMKKDHCINFGDNSHGLPAGAGMCVRREVANVHWRKVEADPLRRALGRTGPGMGAGEDHDLCFSAHDLGLSTGRMMALKIRHLIPKERVTEDYMVRLFAGFEWSEEILHFIRHGSFRLRSVTPVRQLRYIYKICRLRGFARRMFMAEEKARDDARRLVVKLRGSAGKEQ